MSISAGEVLLPEGYAFAELQMIAVAEIAALDKIVWQRLAWLISDWENKLTNTLAAVGVKDPADELVGFGTLQNDHGITLLDTLMVHPSHRRRKIGSAIIRRRVEIADQLGIGTLETELLKSNKSYAVYRELGFTSIGGDPRLLKRFRLAGAL